MDKALLQELLSRADHTLLTQTATWAEIRQVCDDGLAYGAASVCIPPSYVRRAAEYLAGRLAVCTVIGFPNGYSTTAVKCFEAAQAVQEGADEIDMVIDLGWVKDGLWDDVQAEIRAVKDACGGKLLKVIIETCLLTEEEKIKLCKLVAAGGADFIKTSTGFSTAGATFADVALMKQNVPAGLKIKAAGGIFSLEDAAEFVRLGADRLGTSKVVRLVKAGGQLEGGK